MPEQTIRIRGINPLLFGDGRPFSDEDGALSARSLSLPYPSTLAGFLRTRLGEVSGWTWPNDINKALAVTSAGPLLLRNDQPIFPAPADALVIKPESGRPTILPLRPVREGEAGSRCNLPAGIVPPEAPIADNTEGKPAGDYRYWPLGTLTNWLASADGIGHTLAEAIKGPPHELRAHVAIGADGHAEEGMLYTTDLLAFQDGKSEWSLLARLDAAESVAGVGTLGGERRLAALEKAQNPWPSCPPAVRNALGNSGRVRMYLATPGIFSHGWRPRWLENNLTGCPPSVPGLKLKLISAAVPRRQAVSGWDLKARGPKAARWVAPAGSMYFFEVVGGDASALASACWLRSVSDDTENPGDGWGLAMWGVWDYQGAQR